MSNASRTDRVETDESVGRKLKEFFNGVVGKTFSFVVFLLAFGYLINSVAINTGLIQHSTMISVLVGISYSLAGVIVLVGVIVGIVIAVR